MKKETKLNVYANSFIGVVVILIGLVLFNIITAQLKIKADLTEGDLFTLSDGSKKLLENLKEEGDDSVLEIRFYLTQGEKGVPVFVSEHGRRIEDLLDQYKSKSVFSMLRCYLSQTYRIRLKIKLQRN